MPSFTKNKSGRFDVIGTEAEMHVGSLDVTKRDGTTSTVYLAALGRPFVAKFGDLKGQRCQIGTVSQPRAGRRRLPEGYCGYNCPVTNLRCCPENGPCHDCE